MSNCIKSNCETVLDIANFKPSLKEAKDLDGNRVYLDKFEWVLCMAPLTTWREWNHFLNTHVWPHAVADNIRIPMEIWDEGLASEGFMMVHMRDERAPVMQ